MKPFTRVTLFAFNALPSLVLAQNLPPGVTSPLVEECGPATAVVSCINRYASVMPYHFYRQVDTNGSYEDTLQSTVVANDLSWALVGTSDFLVFDIERGFKILGDKPTYEYMFEVDDGEQDMSAL